MSMDGKYIFGVVGKVSAGALVVRTMRVAVFLLLSGVAAQVFGQQVLQENQIWASAVVRNSGQPVIPTYEGWFTNPDGTHSLCFGYFNLNLEQSLEIPHGELNRLEGVDEGVVAVLATPTHFDPLPRRYRRKFCVFTVTVPADFSREDRVVWHLTSADQTFTAQGHVLPPFFLDEPETRGRLKKAPLVTIAEGEEAVRGRRGVHAEKVVEAAVGRPVALSLARIESEVEEVWVGWSKYSGPGEVTFSNAEYEIEGATIVSTQTDATFSEPGEYLIYVQAIESTADFEFFCCHTNAYLRVNVSQ